MTDTELLNQPTTSTTDEPEVAHVGRREEVNRAYVTGEAITALCGVVFVPTRDPSRYPVCPRCREILDRLRAGRGGRN